MTCVPWTIYREDGNGEVVRHHTEHGVTERQAFPRQGQSAVNPYGYPVLKDESEATGSERVELERIRLMDT